MELFILIGAVIVVGVVAGLVNRHSGDYYHQGPYSDHYPDDYNRWHHPRPPQYPYYPPQYPQAPYDPYQEQQREYQLRRYQERLEYNRNVWLILAVVFGLGILAIFFKYEVTGDSKQHPVEDPSKYETPDQDLPRAETPKYEPTSSTFERYEQPQYKFPKEPVEKKKQYNQDRSTLPIYLQASSSRFVHEATRSMEECWELGLNCIHKKVRENGKVWHRVYVGPFETLEDAGELKTALGESGWLVVRLEDN